MIAAYLRFPLKARVRWWAALSMLIAAPLVWGLRAQGGSPDIRIDTTALSFVPPTNNRHIYVELDWMETTGHTHKPSQAVIDAIVQTFAREGVQITIDVSNAIPEQATLAITNGPSSSASVQALRATYFNHQGDSRYFYSLWVHNYSLNGSFTTSSGIADLPGSTHIVSLGSFSGQTGTFSNQVGTFIHEFGHNIGQLHGGVDNNNYKPNYASVMNYFYQLDGVGPSMVALGFANTGSGLNTFGYSHGLLPNLNEAALNENLGIGLGRAIDWNCDSVISASVAKDIQAQNPCSASGGLSTLTDFDNWSSINSYVMTGVTPPLLQANEPSPMCVTPEENLPIRNAIEALRAQGVLPPESALVEQGQPSADAGASARYFDVVNDGSATLNVTGMTLDSAAPWITWEPKTFSVAPGQAQRVQVYVNFAMIPPGQTTRRLIVASNDPDENPYPTGVFVTIGVPLSAAVDMNGDGSSDLLFESTSGALNAWFMSGQNRTGGAFLSPASVDPNFKVVGMRDFTGDGKPDLLLQNQQTSAVLFWAMDGLNRISEQTIPLGANSPWRIVATGDMNNDGYADIVWENFDVGQFYMWYMKPASGSIGYGGVAGAFSGDYVRDGSQNVLTLGPTTLRVVGTGDVNNDAMTDLILQDDVTGALTTRLMQGTRSFSYALTPGAVNPVWKIRAVADYNNDQRLDLLFQNPTTGELYVWFMNFTTLGSSGYLFPGAVNPIWQVIGPR